MTRFLSVLAATALAAAVAAAISLPAGADAPAPDQPDATFVDCLRAHDVGIPADARGDAIKAWIVAHDSAALRDAVGPCKAKAGAAPPPAELIACLRDHGLDPPATIEALKPWVGGQFAIPASRGALRACGIAQGPTDHKPAQGPDKRSAICGGDPAPAESARR